MFFAGNSLSYEDLKNLYNTKNTYRITAVDTSGNESPFAGPIIIKLEDLDGSIRAWQNYVRTCKGEDFTDIYVEVEQDNTPVEVNI